MNKEALQDAAAGNAKKHAAFIMFLAISTCIFWKALDALVLYSLHDESCSHIILIPFISLFLIYTERKKIFLETRTSISFSALLILIGAFIYWVADRHSFADGGRQFLSAATLSIVSVWIGGFALCYGNRALRAAIFPLLFLLLMVPLPDPVLSRTIYYLQQGSTEIAYLLFKAVGVPVLRQGFLLSLPGVTIEVAKECSSIRSSIALFITCLLAIHFLLRTPWKMVLFMVLVLPLSVIKNGIRIFTLTLLSIYVDPSFLHGSLHRDGGFVFFLLALAILWPVLVLLQKSEEPGRQVSSEARGKAASGFVAE